MTLLRSVEERPLDRRASVPASAEAARPRSTNPAAAAAEAEDRSIRAGQGNERGG